MSFRGEEIRRLIAEGLKEDLTFKEIVKRILVHFPSVTAAEITDALRLVNEEYWTKARTEQSCS